jgi:hypothetical protein
MSYPLWDLAGDLAVAQARPTTPIDPALAEAVEARTLRRRIAAILWIPGAAGVLFVGGWSGSVIVGVVGFALLLVGLFLFAERGDRLAGWIRSRRS